MENNENLVTEEIVTENVEQTTEETQTVEKTYTQAEVDDIVGKAKYRAKAQIKKEYDRKYGNLENVLKAGTGKDSVEEMTDTFEKFYKAKGIDIPKEPTYSNRDLEILARAEADDIIKMGFEEVVEETDRLAEIGIDNMSARERATFMALAEYRDRTEKGKELAKIGITDDVLDSKDFKDFASNFNSNTPITKIYEIYNKTQPKKEIKTMGSIKNNSGNNGGVKEYYSPEEAKKFSREDLDKNPELFKAIEKSMWKWNKK